MISNVHVDQVITEVNQPPRAGRELIIKYTYNADYHCKRNIYYIPNKILMG